MRSGRSPLRLALSLGAALAVGFGARAASADESIIKTPGDHPQYRFEAEPHALVGFGGPFRDGRGELGAGFRGSLVLVDNGFVPSINNSVALGVGLDAFFARGTLFVPVVMQWNFWLTNHWSVYGEPGLGFAFNQFAGRDTFHPILAVGGRYHFTDKIALTMRLGYPAFAVGVSFFL